MSGNNNGIGCSLGCWLLAAGMGAVATILMLVLGDVRFIAAVFLGGVLFVVLGLLLSWIFCRELPPMQVAGSAGKSDEPAAPAAKKPAPAAAPATPAATPKPAPKPAPAAETTPDYDGDGVREGAGEGTTPETLAAARGGTPDNLKQIKGVGPKLEALLHSMGFYHFDQIASWGDQEVAWVDANLKGFKGRVSRDGWVAQAKTLAAGGSTEFSKRVKKGDVY